MADNAPALDEISWRDAQFASQHGIHENTVLHYFALSPFFDPMSNNGFIVNQATYNANMAHLIATRSAMEGRLKTMSGLEFVIAQEPAEMGPGTGTGVWVIRKQTRRKRPPEEDEITVHATYYVVGDNVYLASPMGDILGNRMLSILTSLQSVANNTIHAPRSDPWLNADYATPLPDPSETTPTKRPESQSKEPTPLPDFPSFTTTSTNSSSPSRSSRKAPASLPKDSSNLTTSTASSSFLLDETLSIALKYGDEYIDEQPITGEPGSFHLSASQGDKAGEKVKSLDKGVARVDWEKLMREQGEAKSSLGTKTDGDNLDGKKAGKSPNMLAGLGGLGTGTAGGGVPKIRRKKSKVVGIGSPGTPIG